MNPPNDSSAPAHEPSRETPTVPLTDHRVDALWAAYLEAQKGEKRGGWRDWTQSIVQTLATLGVFGAMLVLHQNLGKVEGALNEQRDLGKETRAEYKELQVDMKGLRADVSTLKTDVAVIKTEVNALVVDVAEVKADVKEILRRLPAAAPKGRP